MSVLGIDIGTSSVKATVLSQNGTVLYKKQLGYALSISQDDQEMYELDPEEVWNKTTLAIKRCNASCAADPISALAFSCQGEAMIPIGRNGSPLSNAPISADKRGESYASFLKKKHGVHKLYQITGQASEPIHSIFKIMWFRDHRPTLFKETKKFLCFDGYFQFRLGCQPAVDETMAARTMLYDIMARTWSSLLLAEAGLQSSQLPRVISSGGIVGNVDPSLGQRIGFTQDVMVLSGGHDQPCAVLGSGIAKEGLCYTIGTTECLSWISPARYDNLKTAVPTYCACLPDSFISLIGSQSGGRFFSWMIELLSCNEDDFYRMLKKVPPRYETNVIVFPHLNGSGMYFNNMDAKCMVFGLTMKTRREDILKAILEGITFEQFLTFSNLEGMDIASCGGSLKAVGGGARLENWLQIKADIFSIQVDKMRDPDSSSLGASILAGLGAGIFASYKEAAGRCNDIEKSFIPDKSMSRYYEMKIEEYISLFKTMYKTGVANEFND